MKNELKYDNGWFSSGWVWSLTYTSTWVFVHIHLQDWFQEAAKFFNASTDSIQVVNLPNRADNPPVGLSLLYLHVDVVALSNSTWPDFIQDCLGGGVGNELLVLSQNCQTQHLKYRSNVFDWRYGVDN